MSSRLILQMQSIRSGSAFTLRTPYLSLQRPYSAVNPTLNMPNYPSTCKELTEEIQESPTALRLGLTEAGQELRCRCYNCGQLGHISYDCKFPQVRKACYTCGNQGHLARDCPQRKKILVCYQCKQVGHVTADCPSRSKQEDRSVANSFQSSSSSIE